MCAHAVNPSSVFGARLRARRKALGLSQEKLGVSIGLDESCSRTRISRYETGAHEPALATSIRLAQALNVPLAYLYCENDTMAEIIRLLGQLAPHTETVVLAQVEKELDEQNSNELSYLKIPAKNWDNAS